MALRVGTCLSGLNHFLILAVWIRNRVLTIAFVLAVAACGLLIARYTVAAATVALPAIFLVLLPILRILHNCILVWRIFPDWEILRRLSTDRETLFRMGISEERVEALVSKAATVKEVLVAEFDQNNRVISMVGDIPIFSASLISDEEFQIRSRNRTQLVVANSIVCVKKSYSSIMCFYREALALKALDRIDGLPRIVSINLRRRMLYQSFLVGRNLGSMMADNGAPVSLQHQVSVQYPGAGNWSALVNRCCSEREQAINVLKKVISLDTMRGITELYEKIHRYRVIVGDIKYGNVIFLEGVPFLCDFDYSRVYRNNSVRFLRERERERDFVSFVFGLWDINGKGMT